MKTTRMLSESQDQKSEEGKASETTPYGTLHGGADHHFDGIQELDNPMPRWWVNLFIVTIVFGVCYLVWAHVPYFNAKTPEEELVQVSEVKTGGGSAGGTSKGAEMDFMVASKDSEILGQGKQLFVENCQSCHGALGQGGIGPNLTDDFWIHGNTMLGVIDSIQKGVPAQGMPGWEAILGKTKINKIGAYVFSIQGSNPSGAKAPQGDPGKLQP